MDVCLLENLVVSSFIITFILETTQHCDKVSDISSSLKDIGTLFSLFYCLFCFVLCPTVQGTNEDFHVFQHVVKSGNKVAPIQKLRPLLDSTIAVLFEPRSTF